MVYQNPLNIWVVFFFQLNRGHKNLTQQLHALQKREISQNSPGHVSINFDPPRMGGIYQRTTGKVPC